MKKLMFPLLTLTVLGFTAAAASAGPSKTEAQVQGDSAVIQSIDMKVDQYGTNNRASQSGEIRNRTTTSKDGGSTGVVQSGSTTTIQTGEGNEGRSRFRIENETGSSSPRHNR